MQETKKSSEEKIDEILELLEGIGLEFEKIAKEFQRSNELKQGENKVKNNESENVMKVEFYKDPDGRWYVDDDNGFSKSENELVSGIPEIIELFSSGCNRVKVEYDSKKFEGAVKLQLIDTDEYGATYNLEHNNQEYIGWLCKVFFYYFKQVPKELYIKIEGVRI